MEEIKDGRAMLNYEQNVSLRRLIKVVKLDSAPTDELAQAQKESKIKNIDLLKNKI
jgi:hypothetical protein